MEAVTNLHLSGSRATRAGGSRVALRVAHAPSAAGSEVWDTSLGPQKWPWMKEGHAVRGSDTAQSASADSHLTDGLA